MRTSPIVLEETQGEFKSPESSALAPIPIDRSGTDPGTDPDQGGRLLLAGLAAGGAGAVLAGFLLRPMLAGVPPVGPLSLGVAAITLALTAGLSALTPVCSALRTDPVVALRSG